MGNEITTGTINLLFMGIAASIIIPVALILAWKLKTKASIIPTLIGAVTFFVAVVILENIVHSRVLGIDTALSRAITGNIFLYALYGGLMAGIFEETARFLAFKFVLKNHDSKKTAISYGLGHGGFECIYVLCSSYFSLIGLAMLQNSGLMETTLAAVPEAQKERAAAVVAQLMNLQPTDIMLALWERGSAIALHVSLSILVFMAVKQVGKMYAFPLAILLHALFDFVAVMCASNGVPTVVIEIIICALAVGTLVYAVTLYKKMKEPNEAEADADA